MTNSAESRELFVAGDYALVAEGGYDPDFEGRYVQIRVRGYGIRLSLEQVTSLATALSKFVNNTCEYCGHEKKP